MRAPAVSFVCKIVAAAAVGLLACGLALPYAPAFAEGEDAPSAPLASSLMDGSASVIREDVALAAPEGDAAPEPVVGSFTVDGLTFAVTEGSNVQLVGVSLDWQQATGLQAGESSSQPSMPTSEAEGPDANSSALLLPETVAYNGVEYSVSSIGAYAFYLSGVTSVELPASVVNVDDRAFRSSDVTSVEVVEGNPSYSSFDGALYDADTLSLLLIPEGKQGTVLLPKTAESAAPSVFSHCPLVMQISVEEGSAAFASENGLLYDASLTTLLRVPAGATDITIREGCTTIAAGAMEACASLATINAPASVTSISPYLFEQQPETIVAPVAVAAVEEDAKVDSTDEDKPAGATQQLSTMVALNLSSRALPEVDIFEITVMVPASGNISLWRSVGMVLVEDEGLLLAEGVERASSFKAASGEEFEFYVCAPTVMYRQVFNLNSGTSANEDNKYRPVSSPYTPYMTPLPSDEAKNSGVFFGTDGCVNIYGMGTEKGGSAGIPLQYQVGVNTSFNGVNEAVVFMYGSSSNFYDALDKGYGYSGNVLKKYEKVHIYINWPDKTFTYELNGGAWEASADYPEKVNISSFSPNGNQVLPIPKKKGYEFSGWKVSSSEASDYVDDVRITDASNSLIPVNSDRRAKLLYVDKSCALVNLTFDAGWKAKQCTVTFNLNEGSGAKPSNTTATYGSAMPAPSTKVKPTRTNYTFDGWYDTPNSSGGTQYYDADGNSAHDWDKDTTGTITLYARWRCTVTFDRGPATNGTASHLVDQGSTVGDVACPSLTGWSFKGYTDDLGQSSWLYVDANGKQTTYTVDKDTTLYANWVREVTLDKNAEDATAGDLGKLNACIGRPLGQVCNQMEDNHVSQPIRSLFDQGPSNVKGWAPTRPGYAFQGYYDTEEDTGGTCYISADGTGTSVISKTPTTLYARWAPKQYPVTFDLNGGKGAKPDDAKATYGSAMPKLSTATAPTWTGYRFEGWYDAKTGGTKYYNADGTSAHKWDKDVTGTTTLYAQWFMGSALFKANGDDETGGGLYFYTYYDSESHPIDSLQGGASHSVTWAGGTMIWGSKSVGVGGSFAVHYFPATNSPLYWFTAKRTGYVQTAWEGVSPDGEKVVISTENTGPIQNGWTYTAKWEAKTYDVSFDARGGTIQDAPTWSPESKISYGSEAWSTVDVPKKTGFAFLGWFTEPEGGDQVYDASGKAVTGTKYWDSQGCWCYDTDKEVTLYAQWFMGSALFKANGDDETGGGLYFYTYANSQLSPIEDLQGDASHTVTWAGGTYIFASGDRPAGGAFAVHYYPDVSGPLCLFSAKRTGYVQTAWEGVSPDGKQTTKIDNSKETIRDGWTYTARWEPVLSVDVPIEVTAQVDLLGIEDQVPASGYIESRCGAALAVEEVSFTALAGAADLFGEANTASVSLQALALEGDASWDASTPTFSFPLNANAAESDASKLAALRMETYKDHIPIGYRFAIPEDVLASIDPARFEQVTTPVCSVSYTVALASA